tara:strand:- start:517 stop:699 length:183 start_codon:yes stop_codon:yes gene_type:complete
MTSCKFQLGGINNIIRGENDEIKRELDEIKMMIEEMNKRQETLQIMLNESLEKMMAKQTK